MNFPDAHTHDTKGDGPKIISIVELDKITDDQLNHYFTLGIHPWAINKFELPFLEKVIDKYKGHQNFVGIGELGLDKLSDNFEKQRVLFELQIKLAIKLNIDRLVFHCVKAQNEMLEIFQKLNYTGEILWHGLNANHQQIDQILNLKNHNYIGLGHLVLSNTRIANNIGTIPLDNILIETDDKKELDISLIYQCIASTKEIDIAELRAKILKNFLKFANASD